VEEGRRRGGRGAEEGRKSSGWPISGPEALLHNIQYLLTLRRWAKSQPGFSDRYREKSEVGPPASRKPAGDRCWCVPGNSPAKIWPIKPIYGPEALFFLECQGKSINIAPKQHVVKHGPASKGAVRDTSTTTAHERHSGYSILKQASQQYKKYVRICGGLAALFF
jgi:hypothetical protein